MRTIKFTVSENYDKERQEEFYKVEYGNLQKKVKYETTCKVSLYNEIKSVCNFLNAKAEITFGNTLEY